VIEGLPAAAVLVDSPRGPLVGWVESADRTALLLAFPLAKSNLPLKLAFPLLVSNALDALFAARRTGDEEEILRTGEPLERRAAPGAILRVAPPGGRPPQEVAAGPDGRAAFRATHAAGLHGVTVDGREGTAAVSLLSRSESDIAPRARIEAGGVAHAARPEAIRANRVLRDPLLLAALGLLLLEWFLWTRRR
jgi:Ca-activated chloride channel family protein